MNAFLLMACLIVLSSASNEDGKNILFFFGAGSRSHDIAVFPLAFELARRGHNVTMIKSSRKSDPMDGQINLIRFNNDHGETCEKELTQAELDVKEEPSVTDCFYQQKRLFSVYRAYFLGAIESHVKITKKVLATNTKFDVVINDVFPTNEIAFFLSYKLKVPHIIFSSYQMSVSNMDEALGNQWNPAVLMTPFVDASGSMTFMQRVGNTISLALNSAIMNKLITYQDERIDHYFPEDKNRPSLQELRKNTALGLQYGHPLIGDGSRPLPFNHILIGMMSCLPTGEIKDEKILNFVNSKLAKENGVIIVSFGSILKAHLMAKEKKAALVKVFSQLKQQIVWRWEEELEAELPNVFTTKWHPQTQLLNHPNTRMIINHGGQGSLQESWCHKIPQVVISVFGDQLNNGNEVQASRTGLHIPYKQLNEDNLFDAVSKVLNDESFTENVKKLGNLLNDHERHPLDKAVWWIEYVLRNPDLKLSKPYHEMTWFQYNLVDVYAFMIAVSSAIAVLFFSFVKCLWRNCCISSSSVKSKTE